MTFYQMTLNALAKMSEDQYLEAVDSLSLDSPTSHGFVLDLATSMMQGLANSEGFQAEMRCNGSVKAARYIADCFEACIFGALACQGDMIDHADLIERMAKENPFDLQRHRPSNLGQS